MNISTKSLSYKLLKPIHSKHLNRKPLRVGELLRVLHILSQQPGKTGSGVYLQAIVSQGARAGIMQSVIMGLPLGEPLPDMPPLYSENMHPVFFQSRALPFPIPGMSDVMPYESTRFSSFTAEMLERYLKAFSRAISSTVREFKPHIIHTHHLWLVSALTRLLNPAIPMVTSCHGTELRQLVLAPHLRPFVVPPCSLIDRVLALHPTQAQHLSAEYNLADEQISLIGTGYRDDIFCCDDTDENDDQIRTELRMVYAGKISKAKGVPWLIETLKDIVVPEGYTVRLFLAGSSGGSEGIDILSKIDKTEHRIEYTGALSQEQLATLLKSADLFVLPSFYEGLPMVILEALGCGCRVVVTDLPGLSGWLPEPLIKNGLVQKIPLPRLAHVDEPFEEDLPDFRKHLADAISKQLHQAVSNAEGPQNQLAACIRNFSWECIFAKIKQIYSDLCPAETNPV